jgi:UDP-N-acetylmuramate: L-alanyl-gamma-D-glutamyl-meso-diaminopimelate ligase
MPRQIPQQLQRIHLMAICGTGMGAFAGLLREAGYEVRGSDAGVYPPMSTQLQEQGIDLMEGFCAQNLDWSPDLVVVGNAIRRTNEEATAMRDRDLAWSSFPETLGELFLADRHPVVVAGTHGKTTTCSLLAWCLVALGRDPGFLVGGVLENFGANYRVGAVGAPFVVEGDEYDTAYFEKTPKFIHYRPKSAILTSIEFDHADIYRDLDHVKEAFASFVALLPEDGILIACSDGADVIGISDKTRSKLEYYSTKGDPRATWKGNLIGADAEGMRFSVDRQDERLGEFRCCLVGEHNLANLTAVVGLLTHLGARPQEIADALADYRGVQRRQTVFAEPRGITLIDDFAHHPTAVAATIEATRLRFGTERTLWTVFEPRTNTTRRNIFQADYALAFDGSDQLLVAPVHRSDALSEEERFDPVRLVREVNSRGVQARQMDSVDAIVASLAAEAVPGDVVLILSNGGFGGIYEALPKALA